MKENIIVSEKMRPLWQHLIASLFFTAAISFLAYGLYMANWTDDNAIGIGHHIKSCIYLMGFGIAFSFHQSVYINLKESKFRATIEIGPVKTGTMENDKQLRVRFYIPSTFSKRRKNI